MKILGRVVSTKPISLNRAAKLISRFAAVENGSSPAVSLYLQRSSDAFNRLVQSHDKRSKTKNAISVDSTRENEEEIVNGVKSDGDAASKKKKKRKSGEAEKSGSKKSRDEALDP